MAYLIELKEVKSKDVPPNSYQLWNPAFKHKTLEQVEKQTREYYNVYNYGVFCRETATIHLYFNKEDAG